MNATLSHLPQDKQQELERVTQLIVEVIRPEKVILYGSYATGEWQEDRYSEKHLVYGFDSDYDLLVITKPGDRRKDYEITSQITNLTRYRAPINVITHDITYLNEKLTLGQYFFMEIIQQGILLYDAGKVALSEPKILTAEERKVLAQQDFDKWFLSAKEFLEGAIFYLDRRQYNISVFQLHQAAERIYNSITLVFTGYKHKTHNLSKLRSSTRKYSKELNDVFNFSSEEDEYLFSLLQKGYIDARYNDDFIIHESELKLLISKVESQMNISKELCKTKIESFN